MNRVLVLGAGGSAGQNFIEAASCGYELIGADTDRFFAGTTEKLVPKIGTIANDERACLIHDLAKRTGCSYIHAQPDAEVEFMLRYLKQPGDMHNLYDWKRFQDKAECQRVWVKELRIDFPVLTPNSLGALAQPACYPEWGKYMKLWVRRRRGAGSSGALPVNNLTAAGEWIKLHSAINGGTVADYMITPYLPGREFAVQQLWINGELYHAQARERVVHFFANNMPSRQSSTPAVARVCTDPNVYAAADVAVLALSGRPHGIYGVDMRETAEGHLMPTEVNYGRFFTTSNAFGDIGGDCTPTAYLDYVIEGKLPKKQINTREEGWLWIRRLDSHPTLIHESELQ